MLERLWTGRKDLSEYLEKYYKIHFLNLDFV